MRIWKGNRGLKKEEGLGDKFEWIEMGIGKNREEYGLMKRDLWKEKMEDKKC